MALLERVSTLIRANLNDLIDKAENPEKMLKQIIQDMENQLMQVKTQVAIAMADQHVLERKRQENLDNHAQWVRRAELALDKKDEALARAAIERLRGAPEPSPRAQEAVHIPEAPRVVAAPSPQPVQLQPVQPLPPPILVSTPPADTFGPGSSQPKPGYPSTARMDDPGRPTPPADIPDPRPLDLRADAVDSPAREHTTVAEDVLSAAKSVFHSVLPK